MSISSQHPAPTELPTQSEPAGTRDPKGRFKPAVARDEIYELVQDVTLTATQGDLTAAHMITTSLWNTARRQVATPGPKTASAVSKALGMEWAECVHVALMEPGKRAVARAARQPGEGRQASKDLIRRALQAAAYRWGSTPNPDAYDQVVSQIEAERVRRFGRDFGLPSSRTIRARYIAWDDACVDAGLEPPVRPIRHEAPEPYEVFMDCVRETGYAPSKTWFDAWCKIRRRMLTANVHSEMVAKARAAWEADGSTWPDKCPRKFPLPEADEALVGDRERRGHWTEERILDALRRYVEDADRDGASVTQRHYRLTARDRKDLDLPAASQLTKHGWIADLVRRARAGKTRIPK